jgi:hypothetical protein
MDIAKGPHGGSGLFKTLLNEMIPISLLTIALEKLQVGSVFVLK